MDTLIILCGLLALLLTGIPIGISLALVGIALILSLGVPLASIPQDFLSSINNFVLLAIPIFLLTSNILLKAGVARDLFDAVQTWVGNVRGGLAMATILSCGIFAAISGSSVAVAAMIGTVAIPEMTRRGYDRRFVMGTLAAGATLGILIPPSVPLIIYSAVAEQSTASMFLAGIGPGLALIGLFVCYCVIKSFIGGAPVITKGEGGEGSTRFRATLKALPTISIAFIMIGGIYSGVFTPTESAAVGLIFTLAYVLLFKRNLTFQQLREAVTGAGLTTSKLLMIIAGASVFGKGIMLYRIPYEISTWIASSISTPFMFILIVFFVLLLLGLFLEGIAMILIVIPILLPSLGIHGIDPVWFGIFFVLMIELALLTPPVGMNLFVIQSISGSPLSDVVRGVVPFVAILMAMVFIIYFFPQIVLFIPNYS